MNARDRILNRLRQAQKNPHPQTPSPKMREGASKRELADETPLPPLWGQGAGGWGGVRRRMLPLPELSDEERLECFASEAAALGCVVYRVSRGEALEQIMDLLDGDKSVLSWAEEELPYPGLHELLASLDVSVAPPDDGNIRVGITGVSAALAATGSLVLESGAGRPRSASLLPDRHIALLTPEQLLNDLESWQSAQQTLGYPAFKDASNTVIVTGPSKTADIGHQLVKGAHGPRELHIIVLD